MDLTGARRVAVVAAMVPELDPLVRELGLTPLALDGARAFQGLAGSHEVVAAVTSMGTRAATDVTARLLDRHPADHVVVIGVCGGVDRSRTIGGLVVPEVVVDEASGAAHRPVTLGPGAPSGTLLTTDVLHRDPATIGGFRARGVVALDMETAAVGAACAQRGVPWSVFRAISDWAGDPDVDQELLAMSNADGTPNPRAIVRFLLRRPQRIPKLIRLAGGLRAAVRATTDATLIELRRG